MLDNDTLGKIGSAGAGSITAILTHLGEAFIAGLGGALGGLVLRLVYLKWFKKHFEK